MIELTNRELASIIVVAAVVGVFLLTPRLRRQVGPPFANPLRAFFAWRIQLLLALYFAYAFGVVFIAARLGLWNRVLLKETLLIVCFLGLPMLFSASKVTQGTKLVRDVVLGVIGVPALVGAYVNLGSLPLWGELLLQPVAFLLGALAAVTRRNPEHRTVEGLANWLRGIIGVGLLLYIAWLIRSAWTTETFALEATKFLLSGCLSVALIPFVYMSSFIMRCETILAMLPFFNDRKNPSMRVRIACIWGLRFSTKLATEFTGQWRQRIARASGFRDGCKIMALFREAVREQDHALQAYEERLRRMTGLDGADGEGLRLDRREFHATKRALRDLYHLEMAQYRHRGGSYEPELLDILGGVTGEGLPEPHGIHLVVRKDKQAWRAWRRTPCGWYFGVGGADTLEDQWQYDGPVAPSRFPADGARGWVNVTIGPSSAEWARNDESPTRD